jgi:hypothetical protein
VIADEPSVLLKIDTESIRSTAAQTPAATVHEYAATSLARRLKTMTMLLRDADL